MMIGCALIDRLVEEAMSGKYLDSNFSLPCPPGLDIPPEIVNPFTSNSLKVNSTQPNTHHTHTVHLLHPSVSLHPDYLLTMTFLPTNYVIFSLISVSILFPGQDI